MDGLFRVFGLNNSVSVQRIFILMTASVNADLFFYADRFEED
jgi:hypothetical protein